MLTADDNLWMTTLVKLLKAGKPSIDVKLMAHEITDAPDLKLYELLVVCQASRFAVGLDYNVVRTMHRSADRCAHWLQQIVQGRIPGQFYMYCLSPAHQARIARGSGQNPVKSRLVNHGDDYGIGDVANPGASAELLKIFDNAAADDADRLKVSRRRNFDSKWEDSVLMERKRRERLAASRLVDTQGRPMAS